MKERVLDQDKFRGLHVREDPTKAPSGSAMTMTNVLISDRGGIKKRPGVKLLGDYNTDDGRSRGFFVMKKTDNSTEIPIKAYGTELEYYHPLTLAWETLKDGYTDGSDFGFVHGFARTGFEDYVYFGNRTEEDSRWIGESTQVNGALTGGEVAVTVDTVLRTDVYESDTATSANATTVTVSTQTWTADQWINFYIYITSGAHAGKIRKITDSTGTILTFDTLGTTPGTATFEIRLNKFPATGTLIVGGTTVAYTAIPTATTFTVASAPVAADNAAVTLVPEVVSGNPRGNRMEVFQGRRYVANVRSSLQRDGGGALSGAAQPGSVFVSKVVNYKFPSNDLNDFSIASPRVAGDGDIIAGTTGGAGHRDIVQHENEVFMLKPFAIESVKFTQDALDLATLRPIANAYGSIMRSIKGRDDVFFVTSDKQFTSLSRVATRDQREQAINIGLPVKRLLESYGYDNNAMGAEYKNRVHIPVKKTENDSTTSRLLMYNMDGFFEGEWWLPVDNMDTYGNNLYASMSNQPNVVKLYEGLNDVLGKSGDNNYAYPISSEYKGNWESVAKSRFSQQEVSLFACEGYILGGTELKFKLFKDLEATPFLEFSFAGTESTVDADLQNIFLGSLPKGIAPLASFSETVDNEGMRHFMFMVYFPFIHAEHITWGFTNTGKDQNYEIIRAGMNLKEDSILDFKSRVKSLT